MAQTEGPSHILIIYKVDRSGDRLPEMSRIDRFDLLLCLFCRK